MIARRRLLPRARPSRQRAGLPVRSRRGVDEDRGGPRGRVEGDVRRLPEGARGEDGRAVRALRPGCRLRRVRRRQAALRGRARRSSPRGRSSCRPARRATPGRGDGRRPRQSQERARPAADPRARGGGLRGVGAGTCAPRRRPGCAARWSPRARTARTCSWPRASRICSRSASTGWSRSAAAARQARAGHLPGGCPRARRRGRRRPRCSRTRWPVWRRAGGPLRAAWSASTASGQARRAARARRRRRGLGSGRAARAHDRRTTRSRSSPGRCARPTLDLDVLAQAESVFALSNGHIGLRGNLDEGEPQRPARHLPQRLLRDAAAALRRGRLRLPRGRPDRGERDQRQDHPAAGRRRAVRHPLRRAASATSACWTCAPACCGATRRLALSRGPARAGQLHRLVSFVQRSVAAILYEVEAVDAAAAGRRPVGAGRQRAAAGRSPPIRARRPRCGRRWTPSRPSTATLARRCSPTRPTQRPADGGRDGSRGRGAARHRRPAAESTEDEARVTVAADLAPGERLRIVKLLAYGWSSQRSLPAVRDQVARRAGRGKAHGLGRPARRPARVPRRLLGARRRGDRGRRRAPAGRPLRAVPHAAGGRARRSSGRYRPRG